MNKLTFVSGNKVKVKEVKKILGFPILVKDVELDEIQEAEIEKVAIDKAIQAFNKFKTPIFIDDVGLYVKVWNNFPGPLIKWILKAGGGNASVLLKMLEGVNEREATAKSVIAYHDGVKTHVFLGEVSGTVVDRIKGNGFGWDAVFVPEGSNKTYGEMTFEEKNRNSHRKIALEKFREYLDSQIEQKGL